MIKPTNQPAHTERDCDESCHGCPACYVATGETVCDRLCPHAEPEEEPDYEPDYGCVGDIDEGGVR